MNDIPSENKHTFYYFRHLNLNKKYIHKYLKWNHDTDLFQNYYLLVISQYEQTLQLDCVFCCMFYLH